MAKEETQQLIGKVLVDDFIHQYERDAIHIAVAPVIAFQDLYPGQHVGIMFEGTELVGVGEEPIGIVDPFLAANVKKGEKFWLFLYPNTITGLKHNWYHPSFEKYVPSWNHNQKHEDKKAEAKAWLENFASEWNFDWNDMICGALDGSYVTAKGVDIHGASDLKAGDEDKFWRYMSIYTGENFNHEHKEKFGWSCSC